eukprot:5064958-Amphidinium_carterae.1
MRSRTLTASLHSCVCDETRCNGATSARSSLTSPSSISHTMPLPCANWVWQRWKGADMTRRSASLPRVCYWTSTTGNQSMTDALEFMQRE